MQRRFADGNLAFNFVCGIQRERQQPNQQGMPKRASLTRLVAGRKDRIERRSCDQCTKKRQPGNRIKSLIHGNATSAQPT